MLKREWIADAGAEAPAPPFHPQRCRHVVDVRIVVGAGNLTQGIVEMVVRHGDAVAAHQRCRVDQQRARPVIAGHVAAAHRRRACAREEALPVVGGQQGEAGGGGRRRPDGNGRGQEKATEMLPDVARASPSESLLFARRSSPHHRQ